MTAMESAEIIKKHIRKYEESGDFQSALELLGAAEMIFQASQKEFRELPLARKVEIWRERGMSEYAIEDASTNGLNLGVGDVGYNSATPTATQSHSGAPRVR